MKYFQSSSYPIELVLSENLDKRYHMHNHAKHWVLATVISGSVTVEISGNRKECINGDYFIVPPYVPHALSLNKEARILSLCVQKDYFEKCDLAELKDIVQVYIDELCERNIISQVFGKKFVCLLGKMYEVKSNKGSINEEIEKIADLMIYNPEAILSLDELAERVHLNKYRFIKKFKKEIGIPPHQFHIQSRIRRGQKLLRGKITILDVSLEMGFYDQSHFDRAFQKFVGISPIEYVESNEMLA